MGLQANAILQMQAQKRVSDAYFSHVNARFSHIDARFSLGASLAEPTVNVPLTELGGALLTAEGAARTVTRADAMRGAPLAAWPDGDSFVLGAH